MKFRSRKSRALTCLMAFALSGLNPLGRNLALAETPVPVLLSPSELEVPGDLGKLQEIRLAQDPSAPFILLLQDAHAIEEAQRSIWKLITYFKDKYGIRIAGLEGAQGPLDPLLLQAFPDDFIKEKVIEEYLSKSEISGPEAAAVFDTGGMVFSGIENWKLYEENLAASIETEESFLSASAGIERLKSQLNEKRRQLFSPALNTSHEKWDLYTRSGDLEGLLMYFQQEILTGALSELSLSAYPKLEAFFEYGKYLAEHAALRGGILALAEQVKQHQDRLSLNEKKFFYAQLQHFQTAQGDGGELADFLVNTAKNLRLDASAVSDEVKGLYASYRSLKNVTGPELLNELRAFYDAALELLAETPEQRAIMMKYQDLYRIESLFNLSLTRDEWTRWNAGAPPLPESIAEALQPAARFYNLAIQRETAFFQNISALLKKERASSMLVVLGGFHAEGVKNLLAQAGFSYAVVTPHFLSLDGEENYKLILKEGFSFIDEGRGTYYESFTADCLKKLIRRVPAPLTSEVLRKWRNTIFLKLAQSKNLARAPHYTSHIDSLTIAHFAAAKSYPEDGQRLLSELLTGIENEIQSYGNEIKQRLQSPAGKSGNVSFLSLPRVLDPSIEIVQAGTVRPELRSQQEDEEKAAAVAAVLKGFEEARSGAEAVVTTEHWRRLIYFKSGAIQKIFPAPDGEAYKKTMGVGASTNLREVKHLKIKRLDQAGKEALGVPAGSEAFGLVMKYVDKNGDEREAAFYWNGSGYVVPEAETRKAETEAASAAVVEGFKKARSGQEAVVTTEYWERLVDLKAGRSHLMFPRPDGANYRKRQTFGARSSIKKVKQLKIKQLDETEKETLGVPVEGEGFRLVMTFVNPDGEEKEAVFVWNGNDYVVPEMEIRKAETDAAVAAVMEGFKKASSGQEAIVMTEHWEHLVYLKSDKRRTLKMIFPRPDGKNYGKLQSFGAKNIQEVRQLLIQRLDEAEKENLGVPPESEGFRLAMKYVNESGNESELLFFWDGEGYILPELETKKAERDKAVEAVTEGFKNARIGQEALITTPHMDRVIDYSTGRLKNIFPQPDGKNIKKAYVLGIGGKLKKVEHLKIKRLDEAEKETLGVPVEIEAFRLTARYVDRLGKRKDAVFYWDGENYVVPEREARRTESEEAAAAVIEGFKEARSGEEAVVKTKYWERLIEFNKRQFQKIFPRPDGTSYGKQHPLGTVSNLKQIESMQIKLLNAEERQAAGIAAEAEAFRLTLKYTDEKGDENETVLFWDGENYVVPELEARQAEVKAAVAAVSEGFKKARAGQEAVIQVEHWERLIYFKAGMLLQIFPGPDGKGIAAQTAIGTGKNIADVKNLTIALLSAEEKEAFGFPAETESFQMTLTYMDKSGKENDALFFWNGDHYADARQVETDLTAAALIGGFETARTGVEAEVTSKYWDRLFYFPTGQLLAAFPQPDGKNYGKHRSFAGLRNIKEIAHIKIKQLDESEKAAAGFSAGQESFRFVLKFIDTEGHEKEAAFFWNGSDYVVPEMEAKRSEVEEAVAAVMEGFKAARSGQEAKVTTRYWDRLFHLKGGYSQQAFPRPDGTNVGKSLRFRVNSSNIKSMEYLKIKLLGEAEKESLRIDAGAEAFGLVLRYVNREGKEQDAQLVWDGERYISLDKLTKDANEAAAGFDFEDLEDYVDGLQDPDLLSPSDIRRMILTAGWEIVAEPYVYQMENFAPFWWHWYINGYLINYLKTHGGTDLLRAPPLYIASGPLGQKTWRLYEKELKAIGVDLPAGTDVDLSRRMLEAAEKRDKEEGVKPQRRTKKILGDMRALTEVVEEESFKRAENYSLFLIPENERAAAIHEMNRVLEEGGLMTLVVPGRFGEGFAEGLQALGFEIEIRDRIELTEQQRARLREVYGSEYGARIIQKLSEAVEFLTARKVRPSAEGMEGIPFPIVRERTRTAGRSEAKESPGQQKEAFINLREIDLNRLPALFGEMPLLDEKIGETFTSESDVLERLKELEKEYDGRPLELLRRIRREVEESPKWRLASGKILARLAGLFFQKILTDANFHRKHEAVSKLKTDPESLTYERLLKLLPAVKEDKRLAQVLAGSDLPLKELVKELNAFGGFMRSELRRGAEAEALDDVDRFVEFSTDLFRRFEGIDDFLNYLSERDRVVEDLRQGLSSASGNYVDTEVLAGRILQTTWHTINGTTPGALASGQGSALRIPQIEKIGQLLSRPDVLFEAYREYYGQTIKLDPASAYLISLSLMPSLKERKEHPAIVRVLSRHFQRLLVVYARQETGSEELIELSRAHPMLLQAVPIPHYQSLTLSKLSHLRTEQNPVLWVASGTRIETSSKQPDAEGFHTDPALLYGLIENQNMKLDQIISLFLLFTHAERLKQLLEEDGYLVPHLGWGSLQAGFDLLSGLLNTKAAAELFSTSA